LTGDGTTGTSSPTPTPAASRTPTATATPSATPKLTPSATPTATATATATRTATATLTPTAMPTVAAALVVSPDSANFSAKLGKRSKAKKITAANKGTVAITLIGANVTGSFELSRACGSSLKPK